MRISAGMAAVAAAGLLGVVAAQAADDAGTTAGPAAAVEPVLSKADLGAIQKAGVIRFIIRQADGHLPRDTSPAEVEHHLAEDFAERLGLRAAFVVAPSRAELIPYLLEGRGDVVAASLQKTPEREAQVEFSRPVKLVRQQLVAPVAQPRLGAVGDLAGKTVHVRRSSSFFATLTALRAQVPTLTVVEAPETLETEELMHQVGTGKVPLTVADSDLVADVLGYNDDVHPVLDVTEDVPLGWAMRKENSALHAKVNAFLIEQALTAFKKSRYTGDLDEMVRRKAIRVITRNAGTTYFLHKGEQLGFEYEFARYLAEALKLRLEIVVPPNRAEMLRYVQEGLGDVVAAGVTVTPERQAQVDFSAAYNHVSELVVARRKEDCPASPAQLAGRSVHVRQSSSYAESLRKLAAEGVAVKVVPEDEELETEVLLERVSRGELPLTMADSNILEMETTYRDDLVSCFALGEPRDIAWAIRKDSPRLKAALDGFLKKEYRGVFYNMAVNRYFKNRKNMRETLATRPRQGMLSPFDPPVKRYSAQYDLDWRLMTSQMYQESRFDPTAKSWVGALGLFQVMPQTARELGVGDVTVPELGIHAGIKYMHRLINEFEPDLKTKDRIRFALASYNVGKGHVLDARRLAAEQGLNPDKWFGNVEKAMLLLAQPKHARKARHGYCRGTEPVAYVSQIQTRYDAYSKIAPP